MSGILSRMADFLTIALRIILAPGIVLHELGHLYFCKYTRTKIKGYKLLELDPTTDTVGWVDHENPKNAFLV